MSTRTVAEKMGARPRMRALLLGAPETAVAAMRLPAMDFRSALEGELDHIHLFVTTRAALDKTLPRLAPHLAPNGRLWVSWPKARRLGTDLTLPEVIRIGYARGLVESTCLSVDETWSALKFTHPVPGRVYNNSYGTLPDR